MGHSLRLRLMLCNLKLLVLAGTIQKSIAVGEDSPSHQLRQSVIIIIVIILLGRIPVTEEKRWLQPQLRNLVTFAIV
ncbi:hypothetical protein ZHAS_00014141 [Anopheles sinensis]|uniref:Secreted protein n=1 Tax=Anopheles sinensis TaxID=74873 RepID=A0A084W7E9_ANOSI|nr:hypothetical protein ZHAS_00014141 [Anopheles sinensis]